MTPVVELQQSLRSELKEPLGPLYTDADELLAASGRPLVAVGDVVTCHLLDADETPDVALVDERTKRSAVDETVAETIADAEGFNRELPVSNPAATLTADLLSALREALDTDEATLIRVDGEEDLAALPAVAIATDSASVVYGQPGEGMVLVTVDDQSRSRTRELLDRMAGDTDRLWAILDA